MSYPFVREFQVLLAPFVRFGALSTELDILSGTNSGPAAFLQEEKTPAAQFVFFFVFLFLWFSMS